MVTQKIKPTVTRAQTIRNSFFSPWMIRPSIGNDDIQAPTTADPINIPDMPKRFSNGTYIQNGHVGLSIFIPSFEGWSNSGGENKASAKIMMNIPAANAPRSLTCPTNVDLPSRQA